MIHPPTPSRSRCGTMELHQILLERYPAGRQALADLEKQMHPGIAARVRRPIVTIQVAVHVVWNMPSENISDAQIESQIAALNLDFQAMNPDKSKAPAVWERLVADPGIKFALAPTDPTGKPTSGITRTKTASTSFRNKDNGVKATATGGIDPWPTDRYLNIWVCTLEGSLAGYAQFPGLPPETDGVVIHNTAFGTQGTATAPYNLGRTATHEIGHWLNLFHLWGDKDDCTGTDYCKDTPTQQGPNYNKPTFPHITCNNVPHGDMFMNYMDYVDDDSMFMFTPQQVERMREALVQVRNKIGRP